MVGDSVLDPKVILNSSVGMMYSWDGCVRKFLSVLK
jgi:hypothetical protein